MRRQEDASYFDDLFLCFCSQDHYVLDRYGKCQEKSFYRHHHHHHHEYDDDDDDGKMIFLDIFHRLTGL